MSKIYLPTEYVNMPCKVVNTDYIRVYSDNNRNNYYDVYFNNDYMVKSGTSSYNQNVVCDNINSYTDDIYYRVDFPNIMLMFFIMSIFMFLIPFKVFTRFFRRLK